MKIKVSFLICSLVILFLVISSSLYSRRDFAPTGNTDAPSEQSCASSSCHNSFPLQAQHNSRVVLKADGMVVTDTFKYQKNKTYDMELRLVNPSSRNGFSLTVLNGQSQYIVNSLDASNSMAGAELLFNTALNRSYIGHTNSLNVSSWDFKWNAPSDSQQITFYASANISNNNNSPSGDSIFAMQVSITAKSDTLEDTTAIRIVNNVLKDEINILQNPSYSSYLNFTIDVELPRNFEFKIFTIDGKVIAHKHKFLHSGKQQIQLPIEVKGTHFLYIESDKKIYTTKVLFL